MFELATRKKYSFESTKGLITTEDLWDVPLTDLEIIGNNIQNEINNLTGFVSFTKKTSPELSELEEKYNLIIHIGQTRVAEAEALKKKAENNAEIQELLVLLDEKERDSMDINDVKKRIKKLRKQ